MSSLSTLALKSTNKIVVRYLRDLSNTRSNSLQKLSFTSSTLSSIGVRSFRIMLHQRSLSIMYYIPSLTKSTLSTADKIILCTKSLYLIHHYHSPLLNLTYFDSSYAIVISEIAYTDFIRFVYQIARTFSLP
jgi:hypothetical protein